MPKKTDLTSLYSATTIKDTRGLYNHDPAASHRYDIDLREIIQQIRHLSPNTLHHPPQDVDCILTEFFSDSDLIMKFFVDPHIVNYICDKHISYKKEKAKELKEKAFLPGGAINSVKHEDYEAAVDIVDEFTEMGLDTLDAGQLEIYEENLELVKKYEGS